MATIRSDLTEDVSATALGGVMQTARRKFMIEGLGTASTGAVQEALFTIGVPIPGTPHPAFPNLVAVRHECEIMKDAPDKAYIYVDYEIAGRSVFGLDDSEFRITGGTGLIQTRTSYDAYGNQLSVEHTYPADDEDYPSTTVTHGAEADVLSSQTTLMFEGVIRNSFPHFISADWTGHLNYAPWAGGLAGTWMCTNVAFDLYRAPDPNGFQSTNVLDLFLPSWRFSFEFLFNAAGHQPVIQFVDERKNVPPPDLVAGTGVKQIVWYPYRDFNALLPV